MSCNNNKKEKSDQSVKDSSVVKNDSSIITFGHDLNFLKEKDSNLLVLSLPENPQAQIIVSAKYQAKVFTSTAQGTGGQSFGWVNYKAFNGSLDPHMNAYGGENRFWLGPEGGKYSLFFAPDSTMEFDNWKTPDAFDSESWTIEKSDARSATLTKQMNLLNYKGTHLSLSIERVIQLLSPMEIDRQTGMEISKSFPDIKLVAYLTDNKLTNTGTASWDENTGMPCIWILDMFTPSDKTVIVVPFKKTPATEFNQVAATDYFGAIPEDRLKHTEDVLYLKADGKMRGKLGVRPAKARDWIGSYSADSKVLTLLHYNIDAHAKYLNQQWNTKPPVFDGDAVNAYNDGPLADGSQMGPFYELESVSPAAFLAPGASLTHQQSVYHITGSVEDLNKITLQLLGVSLSDITTAFP